MYPVLIYDVDELTESLLCKIPWLHIFYIT